MSPAISLANLEAYHWVRTWPMSSGSVDKYDAIVCGGLAYKNSSNLSGASLLA